MSRPGHLLLLPAALLYLSSCATLPPEQARARAAAAWLALLPADSAVFVSVQVPQVRPLLEEAARRALPAALAGQASGQEMRAVLERTQRVYAAASPAPDARFPFSVVALGRFRPAAVRCRLGGAAGWHGAEVLQAPEGSLRRERTYFEQRELGLELAAPQAGVVLLSRGGLAQLLERLHQAQAGHPPAAPAAPAEALEALERSALFVYLPAPPPGFGQPGGGASPAGAAAAGIRDLWFACSPHPEASGTYRTEAVFRLQQEKSPRSLEALLRLLLAAWLRGSGLADPAGRLKSAEILAEGAVVRVRGLAFSSEELLLLAGRYLPPPRP